MLISGEDGIRTHAPFRTNGFQDRLVMTTSIPLRVLVSNQCRNNITICFHQCQHFFSLFLSQQPPVQLVVCYKPSKGLCYCSPQRAVSQAFLLVRYKAVLLESSFLDSSACSFIYFCTASSVILPIVST